MGNIVQKSLENQFETETIINMRIADWKGIS